MLCCVDYLFAGHYTFMEVLLHYPINVSAHCLHLKYGKCLGKKLIESLTLEKVYLNKQYTW